MGFRRNYLPSQSQPWTREVQSRVEAMERDVVLSDINNRTRDDQLQSSYNRLDSAFVTLANQQTTLESQQTELTTVSGEADTALQTAITANGLAVDALQEIIDLSSPGGPSINANNISGGTITGITVQTSTSGERVVLSGDEIDFYNDAGQLSGSIQGQYNSQDALTIRNPGGGYIYMEASSGVLMNGGFTGFGNSGVDGNLNVTGSLSVSSFNPSSISTGSVSASSISNSGNYTGNGFPTVANSTTGSFAGNVFINTSGDMFRSTQTSSRDAKENISPIQFDTDAFISVNPVEFNYKAEAVSTAEEAALPQLGFILEDFEDAGVSEHLVIPTNELDDYKGLRYDKLYMYLHKVVQTQNETIKTLEARLDALEAE